ncbi:MAG: glyoxalase superfamily protein, partial [Myxococcales bacterium]|nr:glyoxalase superfamily protein [Myxococcales bacterium]
SLPPVVPVLRSFDERKAKEFYVDFLGFAVTFEHRFDDNAPLYMGLRRGDVVLHISEHFGDACPGAAIRIRIEDLSDYCEVLRDKDYKYVSPGAPEERPWGGKELSIQDPFGNRLTLVDAPRDEGQEPAV